MQASSCEWQSNFVSAFWNLFVVCWRVQEQHFEPPLWVLVTRMPLISTFFASVMACCFPCLLRRNTAATDAFECYYHSLPAMTNIDASMMLVYWHAVLICDYSWLVLLGSFSMVGCDSKKCLNREFCVGFVSFRKLCDNQFVHLAFPKETVPVQI